MARQLAKTSTPNARTTRVAPRRPATHERSTRRSPLPRHKPGRLRRLSAPAVVASKQPKPSTPSKASRARCLNHQTDCGRPCPARYQPDAGFLECPHGYTEHAETGRTLFSVTTWIQPPIFERMAGRGKSARPPSPCTPTWVRAVPALDPPQKRPEWMPGE